MHENLVEVIVPDEEHADAVQALRELGLMGQDGEISLPAVEDGQISLPSNCPHCGAEVEPGFETCWNCGNDL